MVISMVQTLLLASFFSIIFTEILYLLWLSPQLYRCHRREAKQESWCSGMQRYAQARRILFTEGDIRRGWRSDGNDRLNEMFVSQVLQRMSLLQRDRIRTPEPSAYDVWPNT